MRRKADPAKENVREFMAKWRDDARVSWHPSHDEFVGESSKYGSRSQLGGGGGVLMRLVRRHSRKFVTNLDR